MEPIQGAAGIPEMKVSPRPEDLIGDPTRMKHSAFLGKALELGYLTPEEFSDRIGTVLSARTQEDINPALTGLEKYRSDWNAAWETARTKGIFPDLRILPDLPPDLPPEPGWTIGDILGSIALIGFLLLPWLLFALTLQGII